MTEKKDEYRKSIGLLVFWIYISGKIVYSRRYKKLFVS